MSTRTSPSRYCPLDMHRWECILTHRSGSVSWNQHRPDRVIARATRRHMRGAFGNVNPERFAFLSTGTKKGSRP